jgi:hypothetical protein
MTRPSVTRGSVLFCPFCGESFEETAQCPDHELPLVPWSALPSSRPAEDEHDDPVARLSPRHGRGLLLLAAATTLLAFWTLPLGHVEGDPRYGGSLLALAWHGAHRLGLVPAGALALAVATLRRRTRAALRAARLALLLLSLVAPLAVSWAYAGSRDAVVLLAEQSGLSLSLRPGSGLLASWLCALPAWLALAQLWRYRPGGLSESGR